MTIVLKGYVPHSVLNLSSADRWRVCSGSGNVIKAARDRGLISSNETEHSFAGNVAHYIGEHGCNGKSISEFLGVVFESSDGSYSLQVSEDMISTVGIYVDHCRETAARFKQPSISVEVYRSLKSLGIPGLNGGTLDLEIICKQSKTLVVVDYKNGTGHSVSSEQWQTKGYALASLIDLNESLGGRGVSEWFVAEYTVEIHIVQPLDYRAEEPLKKSVYKASDLRAWAVHYLIPTAELASTSTKLTPGEHCSMCAFTGCRERAKQSGLSSMSDYINLIKVSEEMSNDTKNTLSQQLTTEEIISVYENAKYIKQVLTDCESLVRSSVEQGSSRFPYELGSGRTVRVIDEEEAFDPDFGKALDYISSDQAYTTVVKTEVIGVGALTNLIRDNLKQAGVKSPKKKADEIVDSMCHRKEGKPSIVPAGTTLPGREMLEIIKNIN